MSETIQSAGHPVSLPRFIEATLHAADPRSGTEMAAQLRMLAGAATELEQDADRWLAEIRPLAATDAGTVGGPFDTVLLCLLEPGVADTAQASGLLHQLVQRLPKPLADLLTPAGVRLLRQRAPLIALAAGMLEPAVTVRSISADDPATLLAVAPHTDVASGRVGRWAAVYRDGLYAGVADTSSRLDEVPPAVAVGWSAKRRLHVITGDPGHPGLHLLRSAGPESNADWPAAGAGAVSATSIVAVTLEGKLVWGVTDGGGPVDIDCPVPPQAVACCGDWTAVAGNGELLVRLADGAWSRPSVHIRSDDLLAAAETHLLIGGASGVLRRLPWRGPGGHEEIALPAGTPVTHLVAGGRLAAAASGRSVAVLVDGAIAAAWSLATTVTALALSADGVCLAIATDDGLLRFWRVDAPAELQLTSYTADSADGTDLLGIGPTVDALAALVCARAVAPPLSVGLFGAWGSGKSFFMRRLEQRVEKVVAETRESGRPQHALWAWRNIRQVRFNAWHYASADVWAGLLEHLLRELSRPRAGRLALPAELDALQRQRLERLAGAQESRAGAVETLETARTGRDLAEESLRQARERLAETRQDATGGIEREARARALDDARQSAATALGRSDLPGVQSFEELWRELTVARAQISAFGAYARDRAGRRRLVLALFAGPVAALAIAAVLWLVQPSLAGIAAAVTGLAAVAGTLAAWLRVATNWAGPRLAALAVAESSVRARERQDQEQVDAAARRRAAADRTVTEAERRLAATERELAEAERAVAASSPGDLLQEYLAGRSLSDDYRSRLGLIGIVRNDLEVLSDAVAAHNAKLADPQGPNPGDDVINRVVLYVDDLDRCRPDVVVRVLEAVHLLLSFPLFVVVVGVDASWVARSLQTVYPQLLKGGEVNADHYLEKIFQLPIWLDQPTSEHARGMLLSLVEDGAAVADGAPRRDANHAGLPVPDGGLAPAPTTRVDGGARRSADAAVASDDVGLATSAPRTLALTADERRAVADLAPLLTRSPRALKRYLNTYRLLKAVVSDRHELEQARFLLAVATGRPDVGERLLVETSAAEPGESLSAIADRLPPEAAAWLNAALPSGTTAAWRAYNCGELSPTARKVRRFVFRTAAADAGNGRPGVAA
jgi:hypothetical protein